MGFWLAGTLPKYLLSGLQNAMNLLAGRGDQYAGTPLREDVMNNSSMFTADRMTHLKIVVVSLVCATLVAGIGIAARVNDGATSNGRFETAVIKVTAPVTAATNDRSTIR
jgi:uncharacterized membrane protein SpoIIM required for sporulation